MLEMRCSQGQRPYESSIYAVDVASGLQSAETTAHAEVLQTTQHLCLHYHILHVDCSTHCDAFNAAGGLSNKLATSGKAAAPTTLSSWVSIMPGAQALADSMEQDEPVMPGGLNLVVMGPPLAGKSTQAHMLADRYQLVVITIDELLMVPSMKHSLSQPDD